MLNWDTRKITLNIIKFEHGFNHRVMYPNDADGIANRVDPDQTAPSGSTLFAQTCQSEKVFLKKLIYCKQCRP